MEHFKGFASKGFEKLRGGVFDLFSKQGVNEEEKEQAPKRNIEYVDEMYEQSVPQYYPDLDDLRMDNLSPFIEETNTVVVPPPVSQSFIDVPIASVMDLSRRMSMQQEQVSEDELDDESVEDDFMVIETKKISTTCPYYYLPFSQSPELCNRLVNHWLEQTWFLPSDWKTSLKVLPAKPSYVPFFVFDVMTFSNFEADVLGEIKEPVSSARPLEVISGHVESEYADIIACGSCSVNLKLIHKLLYQYGFSHHSQRVLPVEPRVYKTQIPLEEPILPVEISKDEAWEISGKTKISDWEEQKCREKLKQRYDIAPADRIKNLRVDTSFSSFQYYVILLPIYFAGFEYAGQTYEVLVSGNRGVVVGNRPIGTGAGGKFLIDKIKSVSNLVADTVPL